jgi:hypothetical protein
MFALESIPYIDLAITSEGIFSRTSGHSTINEPAMSTKNQVRHNYEHTLRVGIRAIHVSNNIHVRTTCGCTTTHLVKYNRALVHVLVCFIDARHLYVSIEMA